MVFVKPTRFVCPLPGLNRLGQFVENPQMEVFPSDPNLGLPPQPVSVSNNTAEPGCVIRMQSVISVIDPKLHVFQVGYSVVRAYVIVMVDIAFRPSAKMQQPTHAVCQISLTVYRDAEVPGLTGLVSTQTSGY